MANYTQKELNLIRIYDPRTRNGLISNLIDITGCLMPDEAELRCLSEAVITKLRRMPEAPMMLAFITSDELAKASSPDEINVEYVCSRLAESGIVNGEITKPEKLANVTVSRISCTFAATPVQASYGFSCTSMIPFSFLLRCIIVFFSLQRTS